MPAQNVQYASILVMGMILLGRVQKRQGKHSESFSELQGRHLFDATEHVDLPFVY